jgi:hypothetical protein
MTLRSSFNPRTCRSIALRSPPDPPFDRLQSPFDPPTANPPDPYADRRLGFRTLEASQPSVGKVAVPARAEILSNILLV